jgi:replicative DNA helicase
MQRSRWPRVVDASVRRQLNQSVSLTRMEIAENKTADELLDAAEARLWEMRRQKSPKGAEMRDLLEILDVTIDDYRSGKRGPAYTPKNQDLKRMLDHMEDQDMMIIGARPGDGKSSLMRSEAFMTARNGTPVCIINMDNGEIDYPRYLVAFITGINSKKLRNPKSMSQDEVDRAKAAIYELKSLPIRIVTMGAPTVDQVLSAMKKAAVDGSKIFYVDYVQQIQNAGMANDPVQNISYSSNKLRGFNMKWRLPLIVASQFNREITHRTGGAPTLSDFKGSGSLEQDATIAVAIRLVDWDDATKAQFPENLVTNARGHQILAEAYDQRVIGVKFYVLKNRNGSTGKSQDIKWDKATNTYSPLVLRDGDRF